MTSLRDLQEHVRSYLGGRTTIDALEDVLARSATEVAATGDDELRGLHNAVWLLIGESDEGLISEDELVSQLTQLVSVSAVLSWSGAAISSVGSQGFARTVDAGTVYRPRRDEDRTEAVVATTAHAESPWAAPAPA